MARRPLCASARYAPGMPFSQRLLRVLSPIALSLVLVSAAGAAESSSLAEERARQAAQFAALDRDGDGLLSDEISPPSGPG